MAIRLNKLILTLFLCLFVLGGYAQESEYSTLPVDSVKVNSFKLGGDIHTFIGHFGTPKNYKEYSDPFPLEGYGKTIYLTYDSMSATFVEFYGKIILSKMLVSGGAYKIELGSIAIDVGASVYSLKSFKESYDFFLKHYSIHEEKAEKHYYVNLLIRTMEYPSYGLLNLKILNDKIAEISFRFDDGT